jgi:aminoglycoside phosphotransferase family enzyme
VDYALKMIRMPQDRMMDEVADRGELQTGHLDRIIDRLAPFYAQAATGPRINKYGEPAIIAYNHEENFSRTEVLAGEMFPRELFEAVRDFARSFLARHRALFLQRIREGRIRDCHGDLHMKNICLADHVHIFDCIEFNHRFRYGDVAADIDFLAMDLDFHGFRDLSRHFVAAFAEASRDPDLLQMLDFYKCYRAYVRGKIHAFTAQDPAQPEASREQARQTAQAYFALAGEYAEAGARWAA